jgi:hypothetical protein
MRKITSNDIGTTTYKILNYIINSAISRKKRMRAQLGDMAEVKRLGS